MPASAWQSIPKGVFDLVFPPVCLGCLTPLLPGEERACAVCVSALDSARQVAYCPRCGADVPPFGARLEGCGQCRLERRHTDALVRVAAYESLIGGWIRALKFGQRDDLQFLLAEQMAGAIRAAPWRDEVEVITFVPTCWQHQLLRRVHVTTLLAPLVASESSLPAVPLLRRIRGGPHQVGLTPAQRVQNVKGKFRPARGIRMNGTRVCLIDDVTTTGATLNECARQLLAAGASRVYVAVLAKAGAESHRR